MPVPRAEDGLPPPSPELVLIATLIQAFLEEMPRKRRAPYLRRVGQLLDAQKEGSANVLPFRPRSDDAALAQSRAAAAEWFRRAIQIFLPHV